MNQTRCRVRSRRATVATLLSMILGWVSTPVMAEIPTVLTDKIRQGSGVIDLFVDVTGAELESYLSGGTAFIGVDLNEDASGLESSTSAGVAIKEMELLLQTTAGDFSFTTFYTNTTAMILEEGAATAEEFHTLFGSAGGSDLTSSTTGFDLSTFDDVIELRDISFEGEIIGAQLSLTLLDTAAGAGDNEQFFDFSAGFEEFALLGSADATLLEGAEIGMADAPSNVTYDVAAPSGAPEPHWLLLAGMGVLMLLRRRL
jgi:hypothetical protein